MMAFRSIKAFTLIEALIVVAIMAIVATITFSDSLEAVIRKKINAEDQALALLERDIRVSFENTDLSGTNIASFVNEIGTGDIATAFSTDTNPVYTTTNSNDWFAKIARIRGTAVQLGVAPLPNNQPALAKLLFNHSGNARLLVAAPPEADKQRFMLISLIAQPGELTLPAYQDNTTWFDAIWNTDFTNRNPAASGLWKSILAPDQIAQWEGDSSGTNLYRLRVQRVTLPRFVVTVNNNHATKYAWVYANHDGYSMTFPTPANNPPNPPQSASILAGRQIRVTCGLPADPNAALQTHLFLLREDAVINVDSL